MNPLITKKTAIALNQDPHQQRSECITVLHIGNIFPKTIKNSSRASLLNRKLHETLPRYRLVRKTFNISKNVS